MELKKALEILNRSQHRNTKTRQALLQTLLKLKGPFSAYDVLDALPRKGRRANMDLVTIYRNLRVFEEVGLVCRADFSDDMARYLISEPGHDHHHHHIVCRSCNVIQAIDFCIVEAQEQILKKLGFKDISHRLEFSGLCAACS
jgi:Fur family ferric uptake transcriptional regulator